MWAVIMLELITAYHLLLAMLALTAFSSLFLLYHAVSIYRDLPRWKELSPTMFRMVKGYARRATITSAAFALMAGCAAYLAVA